MSINTHNLVCDFGRHTGTLYTRIPVSYLKWMVNSGHDKAEIAKSELKRRGTVTPNLEISGHAIDRASLKCLDIYNQTKTTDEGIHAWLNRMANEALKTEPNDKGLYDYERMIFAFEQGCEWPVLKTVMRSKK